MTIRAFLCHASEDKPQVRDLYAALKERGYSPWLDEVDLVGGEDWDQAIQRAVRKSDVVLVCLSPHSTVKTGYLQKEIRVALDAAEHHPDGQIYIIPVRLCECAIPDRIKRWQAVDLFSAEGFARLERSLIRRSMIDSLWASPESGSEDPEGDVNTLKTIQSNVFGMLYPLTEEMRTEFAESVERLVEDQSIHSVLQTCMASRMALAHLHELWLTSDTQRVDNLAAEVERIFDKARPHLLRIEDQRAKQYANHTLQRADAVKKLRSKIPKRKG